MTIIPRLIGASPTGTPAVDRKDDCAVMPIRARPTGSPTTPPVGFRSRAPRKAGLVAGPGLLRSCVFGPASLAIGSRPTRQAGRR
jgi:hypothetical protein